jgi:pyruvate formate lyase activating enzyme
MERGLVFNIQQFSTEDGPGIRTTVFMKACTLRCSWCHNPEALRGCAELVWHDLRCMGDHACLAACPRAALALVPDSLRIDRATCEACGACVDVCPTGALEVIGTLYEPADLLAEVQKDQVFFDESGGGVTVSGGEPLAQPAFVEAFLALAKGAGLHVALDTCASVPWERFESVIPFVDLVLLDLKIWDPERHRAATGADNARIFDNARKLAALGVPLWIRTPIIPGLTDDDDNVSAIGAFIQSSLATVQRWDLLAFSNLGIPKYRRLGMPCALDGTALLTAERMEQIHALAAPYAAHVQWSGATRQEATS